MAQTEMILKHLQQRGSITPIEALERYGCMRLGARIWDLKRQGYAIQTARQEGVNRRGERVFYARYFINQKEGA